MFLNYLSTKEKELFMELANYLMKVDNVIADNEIEMLEGFRHEMNLPVELYSIMNLSKDVLLNEFSKIEKINKKKIIIELLGLALSDKNFDTKENEFLLELCNITQVSENKINELKDLILDLNTIYQKFGLFLNE